MQDPVPVTPPSSTSPPPPPACLNCETLQSHISQLSESVSSYETQRSREQQNKRIVFSQIETLETEVESLKSQIEVLNQTNDRRQQLLEKSRLRQEEIISETKKVATSEVANAKIDLNRMRTEFALIRTQLSQRQSELDSVTIDKDFEIRKLSSQLDVLKQQCEGLEFRCEQNERDLKRANENCKKYREKYSEADERRISLLREIRVVRGERRDGIGTGGDWKGGVKDMGESWKGNLVGLSIQLDEVIEGIEKGGQQLPEGEVGGEEGVVVLRSVAEPIPQMSQLKPFREMDSSTDIDGDLAGPAYSDSSVSVSVPKSVVVSKKSPDPKTGDIETDESESELNVGDVTSSLNGNEPKDEDEDEGMENEFPEMELPDHDDEMEIELSDDEDFGPPSRSKPESPRRPVLVDDDEIELSDEEDFGFPKPKPESQREPEVSSSSSPNLDVDADEIELSDEDDLDFVPATPKSNSKSEPTKKKTTVPDVEIELSDDDEFGFPASRMKSSEPSSQKISVAPTSTGDEIELSDEDDFGFPSSKIADSGFKAKSLDRPPSKITFSPKKNFLSDPFDDDIDLTDSDEDDFGFAASKGSSPRSGSPRRLGSKSPALGVDDEEEISDTVVVPKNVESDALDDVDLTDSDDDFGFAAWKSSWGTGASPGSKSIDDDVELSDEDDFGPPSRASMSSKNLGSDPFDDDDSLSDDDFDAAFQRSRTQQKQGKGSPLHRQVLGRKGPAPSANKTESPLWNDVRGKITRLASHFHDQQRLVHQLKTELDVMKEKLGMPTSPVPKAATELENSDENPQIDLPDVESEHEENPQTDLPDAENEHEGEFGEKNPRLENLSEQLPEILQGHAKEGILPDSVSSEESEVRVSSSSSPQTDLPDVENEHETELGVKSPRLENLSEQLAEIPQRPAKEWIMPSGSVPSDESEVRAFPWPSTEGELGEKSPRLETLPCQLPEILRGRANGEILPSDFIPSDASRVFSSPSTEGELGEKSLAGKSLSPSGLTELLSVLTTGRPFRGADSVSDLTESLHPSNQENRIQKFDPAERERNSRSEDFEDPLAMLMIEKDPEESDALSLVKQESDVRESVLEGAPTEKILEGLSNLLSKMKRKAADESGRAEDLAERLSTAKTALTDSTDVGATLASELSQMNQSLDGVSSAKSSLEARCADLEKALKIANTERGDCRRARDEIESKLSALEKEHLETCDQLLLEQASLKAEQLSRAESLQEIADLKKRIASFEDGSPGHSVVPDGEDFVVEPDIPTPKGSDVSGKLDELRSDRDGLRSKFSQAEMMIASLSRSNVDSLSAIADRTSECKQLKEAVLFLRDRYTEGLDMASQRFSTFVTSTDDGLSALSLRLENLTKKMEYIISPLRPPTEVISETDSDAQLHVPPNDDPFSEPVVDKYSRVAPNEQFSEPGSDSGMDVSPCADPFSVSSVDHNFEGSDFARPRRFKVIAGDDFSTSGPHWRGSSVRVPREVPVAFDVVTGSPPPKASDREITALDFDGAVRDLQSLTPHDVREVSGYRSPPSLVLKLVKAVLILLGIESPTRSLEWKKTKVLLRRQTVRKVSLRFDSRQVSRRSYFHVRKLIQGMQRSKVVQTSKCLTVLYDFTKSSLDVIRIRLRKTRRTVSEFM